MGNGGSLTSATFFFFFTAFFGGISPVQRRLLERCRCETRPSRRADAAQRQDQHYNSYNGNGMAEADKYFVGCTLRWSVAISGCQ